ncbi:cilia- and flagella-associated protein 47-like [Ctenodactylus gundi]
MGSSRGSLTSLDMDIRKLEVQLLVTPLELKFPDALTDRVYRLPLTIQNFGPWTRKIRFKEPSKPQFKLMLTNLCEELAPGFQMTVVVEYHPDRGEDTFDQLIISAGTKRVEIPLIGLTPSCKLEIDSVVDFDTLLCSHKAYSKDVSIINHGKVPGMFNIEYQGQVPILFFPACGTVKPESSVIVRVKFYAYQPNLVNEVAKPIVDDDKSIEPSHRQDYAFFMRLDSLESEDVSLTGSNYKSIKSIFPLVIKPTGHFVVKDVAKYKDRTPTAMLQSAKTRLHDLQLNEDGSLKDTLIPLPNDRAASIRPGKCDKCCRPVFTKISRHNYPDFDFAEFEKIEQRRNQNYYSEYTKKLKIMHLKKQAEREDTHPANATSVDMHPSNDRDIDVHPSSDSDMVIQSTCDLTSPLISQEEIEEERSLTECLIKASGLSTREIAYKEVEPLERKVLKALKSDPCTRQEKHDCSINLTPKQIQQVIVGPSVINFGYICLNSTNTRLLHVVNMLSIHILIQLEVNFEELQKTNQFSYVIPPISNTCISMIFESSSAGKFWKSFTFTVNSTPGGHILVMADVRPIKLQLSSNTIVLKPRGFLWKPSFWGTVTLYNRQNLCAEFGWQVVKAIAFSISPANGIVEAYSSLQCEVMWRPGFGCPEEGELVLHVRGGNTVTLKCVAYFDHTEISISEPTILFENSPQRLTTLRETVLYNVGQNHAYFEVCEQSPLPIINIFPSQGLIPYGGVTVLNISCTSFIAEKFETNAKIFIHRGNNIEVKISGCTEIADVEIRPNLFQFKDTYVGSTTIIPFVVENKGLSRAAVELQLKQFPEFSMYSKDKSGIKPPLELSSTEFIFSIPLHEIDPNNGVVKMQDLILYNASGEALVWSLDLSGSEELFKEDIFSFTTLRGIMDPNEECIISISFSPKQPRKYTADVPIYLNDSQLCYRMIHLNGEVKSPKLLFDPPFVHLPPVPLDVTTGMDVTILPQNYFMNSTLNFPISDDGEVHPISVVFTKDKIIKGSKSGVNKEITCHISFKSSKPVSVFSNLLFHDDNNNWYSLPVAATADNCILTIYPYLAAYLNKNNLILKDEGEKTYNFFQKVVNAAETWFSLFGWPEGPHLLSIPETIRRDVQKVQFDSSPEKACRKNDVFNSDKTIFDVLLHLNGKMPPEIYASSSLPENDTERVMQLFLQHSSLLNFLDVQGGCVSHILPEFLFDPEDYKKWLEISSSSKHKESCTVTTDMDKFDSWSKRAWTDVFLQIYKVLVLSRVLPCLSSALPMINVHNKPTLNPNFESSNIYSDAERILLSWLNTNYENTRHSLWKKSHTGTIPFERWIINFDRDLSDGLVFASQLATYCPFLIESHLVNMYARPNYPEQYLHNCLLIIDCFDEIGLNMNIQAVDIFDPNPIRMLMLCVYMYEKLPEFLPKKVVSFHCALHDTVLREITLKNPSSENIVYTATVTGRDAANFTLIHMGNVTISPNDKSQENIESTSSFYREFFSSVQKLTIRGQESSSLVLYYLPFNIHTRYCAVILSNKQIGELIYVVQGKGLAPLPSSFPPPYDTSEDEVTHFPEEEENKEVKILYLECRLRKPLRVRIKLPLTNEAKERALAFAAQQQISAFEHEQRLLTGTLESSSIRVATGLLGLSKIESPLVFHLSKLKKPKSVSYTAELSHSDFFSTPEKTYTPEFPQTLPKFTLFQRFHQASVTGDERSQMQKPGGQEDADGFISFPLRFFPPGPGCYPCKILLTSKYDVLIFQVEVVVYKEHTETIVEFEAPAFEEVTQRIRIGKLIVKNEADGLEKVIILKGIGTKPPAFGSVVIHCKVGNVSNTSITVPNNYNSTITYEVSSDIPIVWGDSHITIEPVSSAPYVILVYPRKRGILQGTISFSLKDENDYDLQEETDEDKKFSSPKLSALSPIFTAKDLDDELPNLRVWYQLEIHTSPKKPIKVIEIECVALESTCIEIPISNPSDETVRIDVKLSNSTLSGPKELVLNPLECVNYVVWYSSATIGCIEERYVIQNVTLNNPTPETLTLNVTNSNPENYALDIQRTPFGEWKFDLCGVGLFPRPLETVKLSTFIGYEASVVIDFKNPTNENVFLNVMLTNEKKPEHIAIDHCWDSFMEENNAFQFSSLTYTQGILLPPKENIDISVSYMPQHMVLSKSIIIIQMMKESRKMWSIDNFDELDTNFKRTMGLDTEEIRAVHWMYPLIGLPQAPLPKSLPLIPKTREFEYEIEFESEDFRNRFQSCVDLRLEKKSYSIEHEMITLLFNLKFAPKKLFRCHATLKIESITDGIWKFPFILIVNKPEVDNIINIRGAGLFKESIAELKLTTKSRYPEKFTASFLPGNDPEIFVKPSAGELPPCTCDGTVITVGFKPQLYSKKYKAVLAIQVSSMRAVIKGA